ncbi:hypothetical protein ACI79C_19100 [Geodermatophilus sp. SYSU D00697]
MRIYDPADGILYVHLAQTPAAPAAPRPAGDECDRLPAGYANTSPRVRLGGPRTAGTRPALVLLPGGAAAADLPTSPARALRVAR